MELGSFPVTPPPLPRPLIPSKETNKKDNHEHALKIKLAPLSWDILENN